MCCWPSGVFEHADARSLLWAGAGGHAHQQQRGNPNSRKSREAGGFVDLTVEDDSDVEMVETVSTFVLFLEQNRVNM